MSEATLFGQNLARLLAERRISAYQLADRSSVPIATIYRILSGGNPSWATVQPLCQALGCSADEFRKKQP